MSPPSVSKIPSAKDAAFMFVVMENNKSPLSVDWDGVAQVMGLKNGSVASVRFGQIKTKLGWSAGQGKARNANSSRGPSSVRVSKSRASPAKRQPPAKPRATGTGRCRGRPQMNAAAAKLKTNIVSNYGSDDGEDLSELNNVKNAEEGEEGRDEIEIEENVNRGSLRDYGEDDEDLISEGTFEEFSRLQQDRELQWQIQAEAGDEEDFDRYEEDIFEDADESEQTKVMPAWFLQGGRQYN